LMMAVVASEAASKSLEADILEARGKKGGARLPKARGGVARRKGGSAQKEGARKVLRGWRKQRPVVVLQWTLTMGWKGARSGAKGRRGFGKGKTDASGSQDDRRHAKVVDVVIVRFGTS
jgi:hypothetical protein